MSDDGIVFGVFMPQGWKMELVGIDGAEAKWAKAVEIAPLAEELGYDSIWVYDHFHNVPRPAHEAVFECWTTMAAISQRTSRIRLGQMVGCNGYRNPGLLAKITSTVDVISGGRLDWGIGAGLVRERVPRLRLRVPDAEGPHRHAARDGRDREEHVDPARDDLRRPHYELTRANCDPKPLQDPHPPVWIGGGGEQLTLRVVARHADCSNFGGKPDEWAHKREVLQGPLRGRRPRRGRDPQDVVAGGVHPARPRPRSWRPAPRSLWGEPFESWRAGNLVGTPEQVCEKIQRLRRPRLHGFIPWCADYPDTETPRAVRRAGDPQLPSEASQPNSGRPPRRRRRVWSPPRPRSVNSIFICTPPATSSTSRSLAPRRSFAPTGTGAGKRTLSAP